MKTRTVLAILAVLSAFSVPVFGADLNEGVFIEGEKFSSSDPAWAATIGAKFKVSGYKGYSLVFNGRIETVSHHSNAFDGGAGLTDIDYRLEPRIYFKDYYLSFNHWSLHKADVPGDVPNLNLATIATERSYGNLSLVAGAQYKMPNSDADYKKILFVDATYFFREKGCGAYVREIVEAVPGVISKTEAGYRFGAKSAKLMKSYDLFAGWQYLGGEKAVSSQYGLAGEGFFAGFSVNF